MTTLRDRTPLRDRARGRWSGILGSLGISSACLRDKHGPCPICGEGRDRFRFDDKDGTGTWICSKCGAGDGVDLLMLLRGWDFKTAAREVEAVIGTAEYTPPKPRQSQEEQRLRMREAWIAAHPITPGDPAGQYLAARTGLTVFPSALKLAPQLSYWDDDGAASYHPAMLAAVTGVDGKGVNIHRTYLSADGTKAAVADPRRMMAGTVPPGAAVRLAPHDGVLGVAEGIETALSASALFRVPCWALISTAIMGKWIAPPDVRELMVFADHDANFAGHAAAYQLAHRVRSSTLTVRVEMPERPGDWNDVHQERLKRERV
jgi:putative DNA primase/helicase